MTSGWSDLNRRPPAPKAGALPSCATARASSFWQKAVTARQSLSPRLRPSRPGILRVGSLAQLAEQRALNPQVRGSSPRRPTLVALYPRPCPAGLRTPLDGSPEARGGRPRLSPDINPFYIILAITSVVCHTPQRIMFGYEKRSPVLERSGFPRHVGQPGAHRAAVCAGRRGFVGWLEGADAIGQSDEGPGRSRASPGGRRVQPPDGTESR